MALTIAGAITGKGAGRRVALGREAKALAASPTSEVLEAASKIRPRSIAADAGALAYHKRPTDLPECLNAVAGAFADRLAGRQLHLQLQLPGHAELLADPDRLRQLFHNLFENSLRYTDPGGTLRIRCRQTPQALELDWEDSAPGVTPEQQAHLFDRFYRADSSRRRAAGGSGLGLAICREIVLAHGGDILAEPSELGGLALHLTFPLRPT